MKKALLEERRTVANLSILSRIAKGSINVGELLSKIRLRMPSTFLRKSHLLHTYKANNLYLYVAKTILVYIIRANRMIDSACRSVNMDLLHTELTYSDKPMCVTHFCLKIKSEYLFLVCIYLALVSRWFHEYLFLFSSSYLLCYL